VLQACVRRTLERAAVWGIAMLDVESLIVDRWDLQTSVSVISQQSSLQKAEAWAEFRRDTEDNLELVSMVSFCRISQFGLCHFGFQSSWPVKLMLKFSCYACACCQVADAAVASLCSQQSRNHEVFCRKLPTQAMAFAGVEFKRRVSLG